MKFRKCYLYRYKLIVKSQRTFALSLWSPEAPLLPLEAILMLAILVLMLNKTNVLSSIMKWDSQSDHNLFIITVQSYHQLTKFEWQIYTHTIAICTTRKRANPVYWCPNKNGTTLTIHKLGISNVANFSISLFS